jgi:3-aminoavenalumate diazotase
MYAWSRFRAVFEPGLRLATLADRVARQYGDRTALRLEAPLFGGRAPTTLTFAQLARIVANVAAFLHETVRLPWGGRVVVYKENAADYLLVGLGTMRAGGIHVPVNGSLGADGLCHMLELTGATVLVTSRASLQRVLASRTLPPTVASVVLTDHAPDPGPGPAVHVLPDLLNGHPPPLEPFGPTDRNVIIAHTSGTTGMPKGVVHHERSVLRGVRLLAAMAPVTFRDRALCTVPFSHHFVTQHGLAGLLAGLPMYPVDTFDPAAVLETIERERITVYVGFPLTYLRMYQLGLDRHDLSSVRMWEVTADAMHEVHTRAFVQQGALVRLGGRPLLRSVLFEGLGTTEIGSPAVVTLRTTASRQFDRYVGRRYPLGPRVRVADRWGVRVPPGATGQLFVKGPTLFRGYWNQHDRTQDVMLDGWWRTGDVVRRDRWGRIYQLDREVDVIHTADGPVYSLEVEEEVLKCPAVGDVAVIGADDGTGHSVPIAVCSLRDGVQVRPADILADLNTRLPAGARLRKVIVLPAAEMPYGVTGKVLKRRLRQSYGTIPGHPPRADARAPVLQLAR